MNLVIDIIKYIPSKLIDVFLFILDWFLSLNLFEKLIILNCIPAFFAVVLPSAKYYIFQSWFTSNNPMSVYMIGLAFYMFFSIFFRGKFKLFSRLIMIMLFIGWTLYFQYGNSFVKCEHVLLTGYYLNYIVAFIYMTASFLSFMAGEG